MILIKLNINMAFIKKLFSFGKKEQTEPTQFQQKMNMNEIYNKSPFLKKNSQVSNGNEKKKEQFELVLEQSIIDLDQLRKLSWRGNPNGNCCNK